MILKPTQLMNPDPITEALEAAGLKQVNVGASENEEAVAARVRKALNTSGASIEDASIALASALNDDTTRLQAAKLTFELHGALKDKTKQELPAISITIHGSALSKEKSLLSILTPQEASLEPAIDISTA